MMFKLPSGNIVKGCRSFFLFIFLHQYGSLPCSTFFFFTSSKKKECNVTGGGKGRRGVNARGKKGNGVRRGEGRGVMVKGKTATPT